MSPYEKILKSLESATNDNKETTRRRFPRRMRDICVLAIGETSYAVNDWSQCGVLFEADGRTFQAGDSFDVVMKFKLTDAVSEIPVSAKVVRASTKQVALEFVDVPKASEKAFTKVIKDAEAQQSQGAEERG